MTDNEIKLINMIHNQKHPDKAMTIAINIICCYLKQPESSAKPIAVDSRESA